MKALSIRQPWLWAILDIPENDCPKRVENRKATAASKLHPPAFAGGALTSGYRIAGQFGAAWTELAAKGAA